MIFSIIFTLFYLKPWFLPQSEISPDNSCQNIVASFALNPLKKYAVQMYWKNSTPFHNEVPIHNFKKNIVWIKKINLNGMYFRLAQNYIIPTTYTIFKKFFVRPITLYHK